MERIRDSFWTHHEDYIPVFGRDHLLYITVLLLLLFLLIAARQRIRHNPEPLRRTFFLVSLIQQLILYSWYFLETGFDLGEALPLHICRVSSLLGMIYLVNKNNRLMDVVFYFGLYAYGSFLYPSLVYSIRHVIGWSFLVNHALTILLPFFAHLAYGWRPERSGLRLASKCFLLYFAGVYLLNLGLDGNYFYLKHRPFLKGLPKTVYVPLLIVFTFLIFWVGYRVANLLVAYSEKKTPSAELEEQTIFKGEMANEREEL